MAAAANYFFALYIFLMRGSVCMLLRRASFPALPRQSCRRPLQSQKLLMVSDHNQGQLRALFLYISILESLLPGLGCVI